MKPNIIPALLLSSLCCVGCATQATKTTSCEPANTTVCAPLESGTGVTLSASSEDSTQEMLTFFEGFVALTPDAQRAEIETSKQALNLNSNDLTHRIKLPVMLSLTSNKLQDIAKAQKMLKDLSEDITLSAKDSALVSLLHAYTQVLDKKQQETKRALTKQDILLERNEALQKQLNDLKNIEKSIIKRTKPDNSK